MVANNYLDVCMTILNWKIMFRVNVFKTLELLKHYHFGILIQKRGFMPLWVVQSSINIVNKGKRGASKCKKKFLDPTQFKIEFDDTGQAIGKNRAIFYSWVGVECRKKIPYHQLAKDVDKQLYDDVWEYTKESWNISDDKAKHVTLKKGKASMRSFRHELVAKYVEKNKTPFKIYDYLDKQYWDSFVANVSTKEFKENGQKASINARKNIEPARVGRGGFTGLEPVYKGRWNQLLSTYPKLDMIQNERSRRYAVSRARLNPVTKLYELGKHLQSEGVLRGTLEELHSKEKEMMADGSYYEPGKDVVTEAIGKGRQHGGAHVYFLSVKKCELLWPFDQGNHDKVLATGLVYPTTERQSLITQLHSVSMPDCTSPQFVQQVQQSRSTHYRPELEESLNYQSLSMSSKDEIPELQRYTMALHDDRVFADLLNDNLLYSNPTESGHVSQPSKATPVSAPKIKNEKVAKILIEVEKSRPPGIYKIAQQLAFMSNETTTITATSPAGMYQKPFTEHVEIEAVIQLCVNGWSDICFVHYFTMYFYTIGRSGGLNQTSYFNPRFIEGAMLLTEKKNVINHIKSVISFEKNKQWFLAPHLVGGHWILILLQCHPRDKSWKGHIFDSLGKGKNPSYYVLKDIIDEAINQKITWNMVNATYLIILKLAYVFVLGFVFDASFDQVLDFHEMNNAGDRLLVALSLTRYYNVKHIIHEFAQGIEDKHLGILGN
ncbi:hypothetical protein E3N88_00717 [Mikania micrantha]|uniref:Ubiquitin-like protease family profile domain-containing protein n=1 Tax=Mikania micrantha TaxID=192012 RepID=A0A5N6Q0T9_9ASTR|nr:hypothetical protein E3N88_00717 [Mikania micrantha]